MKLRWGFKTESNTIARDLRRELGLAPADPLDPWRLASHLEIPVLKLSTFRSEAEDAVVQLAKKDPEAFSAVTVFSGYRRIIVVNDAHAKGRQASSLAHELAHSLLWHQPETAFNGDGVREWNVEQEGEAQWLAGALLVSDEAAVSIVSRGLSLPDAAKLYGTSVDMIRGRLNVTAAQKRLQKTAHRSH